MITLPFTFLLVFLYPVFFFRHIYISPNLQVLGPVLSLKIKSLVLALALSITASATHSLESAVTSHSMSWIINHTSSITALSVHTSHWYQMIMVDEKHVCVNG